ncbi:MAG: tetratricopeptide repeat protein [Xanthobacteraceae bacterium]
MQNAHGKIGDVLLAQRNLPEALESYRAALAVRERLANSKPEHAESQSKLAAVLNKISDVLKEQGKVAEALETYRAWDHHRAARDQEDRPRLGLATIQFQNFCLIRATNSLFGRSNSLLTVAKFPVPLHSEFGCNALKLLLDWAPKSQNWGPNMQNSLLFPCYQGIAPADWCDRDWRPSQP